MPEKFDATDRIAAQAQLPVQQLWMRLHATAFGD